MSGGERTRVYLHLSPPDPWVKPCSDVMDLAVTGWDQERLLDRRDDAATEQRRLRDDGVRRVHPLTVDRELAVGCGFDDAILRAAIQAAPQVIPREPRLNALLDADAVRREWHRLGIVGGSASM
jgi:hypothetical protein